MTAPVRGRVRVVLVALLLVGLGPLAAGRPGAERREPTRAVLSVALTVSDLERSLAFFTAVLGFEAEGVEPRSGVGPAGSRVARLRLGGERVELLEVAPPQRRPVPADSRSHDRWFQHLAIVVSDMTAAHARLTTHGVRAISSAPQILPPSNVAAAGIAAFYFLDPDGHPLELIQFPPGKGDPRWQHGAGRLFLGIDHTAVVVADTDTSLAFYRDRLGLTVVGASLNVGVEQERLTGVPGARVRITGLRAPAGLPGIELLEYRAPTDGRPFPAALLAADLVPWRTTLLVGERTHRLALRDPDGHALELVGTEQ